MNLFINFYDAKDRQDELLFCLNKNVQNRFIKRIIVFDQSICLLNDTKIKPIKVTERPSYQDFFELTNSYPNDVNIIANTDIYFDDSLKNAEMLNDKTCYAITRSELRDNKVLPFDVANPGVKPSYSQDVWMFRGAVKLNGSATVIARSNLTGQFEEIKFTIGIPGCDNVLAARLKGSYQVKNPANDIKCIHVHKNQHRPHYKYRITGARSFWGQVNQGHLPITNL